MYIKDVCNDELKMVKKKHLIKKIKFLNYLCEFLLAGSLILIDGLVVLPYMMIQSVFFFKNVITDKFSSTLNVIFCIEILSKKDLEFPAPSTENLQFFIIVRPFVFTYRGSV